MMQEPPKGRRYSKEALYTWQREGRYSESRASDSCGGPVGPDGCSPVDEGANARGTISPVAGSTITGTASGTAATSVSSNHPRPTNRNTARRQALVSAFIRALALASPLRDSIGTAPVASTERYSVEAVAWTR